MKTLQVGQKVLMVSGPYEREGIVIKLTERCVEVELLFTIGPAGAKNFMRFDTNGKALDSRDINDENMDFDGIPGTLEGGYWELIEPDTIVKRTQRGYTLDTKVAPTLKEDFNASPFWREFADLWRESKHPRKIVYFNMEWRLAVECTPTPTGHILVLSVVEEDGPCSELVEITDEKVLEKLRSLKGQYSIRGNPIYYYEDAHVKY